ncbi:MAG: hypothetical protein RL535_892, partial [Pseudomonadota bacterium]
MSLTLNALQPVNTSLATASWGVVPSLGN